MNLDSVRRRSCSFHFHEADIRSISSLLTSTNRNSWAILCSSWHGQEAITINERTSSWLEDEQNYIHFRMIFKRLQVPLLLLPLCHLSTTRALQPLDFGDIGGADELYLRKPSSTSLLAKNAQAWNLQLDVGLQPGTWMPKRFPGWAASGARLGVGVTVQFDATPSPVGEALVGPLDETYQLKVTSPPSTFVSEKGQETVEFAKGGWCIQRPTANVRNAGGATVKPEGLLKFWLDCPTGAKRKDVEIMPGTRIFFTTGVWDNPDVVAQQEMEYEQSLKGLEQLIEKTKENKEKTKDLNLLQKFGTFREMVTDSRQYDTLKTRCEEYGRQLPPIGSPKAPNGVQIAPNGSLVIKGNADSPDWMPTSEYLILGTFSTAADDSNSR